MPSTLIVNGANIVPSLVVRGGTQLWDEILSPGTYPTYDAHRQTGLKCSRAFKVHADDLQQMATEVLGDFVTLPGLHPRYDGLYCEDMHCEPLAGDNGVKYRQLDTGITEPLYFLVVVNYSPMVFNIQSSTQQPGQNTEDIYDGVVNVSSEVILVDSAAYFWEDKLTERIPESMPVPIVIPIIDREISIPRVSVIPWAQIRACVGAVNATAYAGVQAESMMYLGCAIRFRRLFDGSMVYGLTHKFKEKTFVTKDGIVGWNHLFRSSDGKWVRGGTNGTNGSGPFEPLYKKVSMAGLIPGVV